MKNFDQYYNQYLINIPNLINQYQSHHPSLQYVLHPRPLRLEIVVQLLNTNLLLKHNNGLHQVVERTVQLLPRIPQQIQGQLKPNLQNRKLLQQLRTNIPQLLLVPYTLLNKHINLLLIILNIESGQYLTLRIAAQQPQILIRLVNKMLVHLPHNRSTVTLLRQPDVTTHLLDNFHQVDLLSGNYVTDVRVYYRVLLENLLVLEVDPLLVLVLRVLGDRIETEVLTVVENVRLLANYHTLTCLNLTDRYLVVVEQTLLVLVLIDFAEVSGVAGGNLQQIVGVDSLPVFLRRCNRFYDALLLLFPAFLVQTRLAVHEIQVIEVTDVLEDTTKVVLELHHPLLHDGVQLTPQGLHHLLPPLKQEKDEVRTETAMGLEDDALPAEGEDQVDVLNLYLLTDQRTVELHPVKHHMHGRRTFIHVFVVGVPLRKVGLFLGSLVNIVELDLVGAGHHNGRHFQKFMVLLMEVPLLPTHVLTEYVYVDRLLQFLLPCRFFVLCRLQRTVVVQTVQVDPLAKGVVSLPTLLLAPRSLLLPAHSNQLINRNNTRFQSSTIGLNSDNAACNLDLLSKQDKKLRQTKILADISALSTDLRCLQIDLLNSIDEAEATNELFSQAARTSQQTFLLTYASLHFLRQGQVLPTLEKTLATHTGAYSEVLLTLTYMKHCMSSRINLEDPAFRVLAMLLSWMDRLDKLKKNSQIYLLPSVLQFQPGKLPLNHYTELIVYFSYISRDVQTLLKSSVEFEADDLIELLRLLLPQIHYNIGISNYDGSQSESDAPSEDVLFYNEQIQYFVQTRTPYRSLVRTMLRAILGLELTPKQLRDIVDLASRYYLLFFQDKKQYAESLFLIAFSKASEAVRFSLTKELVTFFKISRKLGTDNLQLLVREKWDWVDSLLVQFKDTAVGQPKQQVSPYNPLAIQQFIQVGSGKIESRTIEIYHQNSLFYFWLSIESRDITMRLYYVGDFESKVEIKKLLFTEEKLTDNAKSTFIATKRGIYQLELDNSYSWMNSKNLKFQYVVLVPHQHQTNPLWLDRLLEIGEVQNEEANEDDNSKGEGETVREEKVHNPPAQQKEIKEEIAREIQRPVERQPETAKTVPKRDNTKDIKEKPVEAREKPIEPASKDKRPTETSKTESTSDSILKNEWKQANLNLIDDTFSLLINTPDHTYEFETNLPERMLKKIKNSLKDAQHTQWAVNGQAREWLRQNDYRLLSKGGVTLLQQANSNDKRKNGSRIE